MRSGTLPRQWLPKLPHSPGTPLFIAPELPSGGKGEAVQEGGVGEGPALLPLQRPLQGRRSGALVQALGRTWGERAGADAEAPLKGAPCRSVLSHPWLRDSHRDSGSLEKRLERPASMGYA